MEIWKLVLLTIFGYLLGSIPFGKLVSGRRGIDIQKHGSGNIGFANVMRVLGWRPAVLVLVGDILKGFLPVQLAQSILTSDWAVLVVALAAMLGHIFPVWLKFRGGKGIATGLGAILAIEPKLGLIGIAAYGVGLLIYKKSAWSSLSAAWLIAVLALAFDVSYFWFYFGLAGLATWTHRSNLAQLAGKHK